MTGKRFFLLIKLAISISALAIIFSQLDLKSVGTAIASAKIPFLALAFILTLILPALNALKIKLLLPGSKIKYHYILFTNFASNFIRLTIPTDIGAELGRGYYLSKKAGSTAAAFSAILLDRYFGFCSQILVVSIVSLVSYLANHTAFWKQVSIVSAAVLFMAITIPILFCRMPVIKRSEKKGFIRVTSAIAQLSEGLLLFRTMPLRLGLAGVISIVSLYLALLMVMALSAAFHESLHFSEASVITFLSTIACLLPSLAGLGFVEGIYTGMFYFFSLHQEIGFTVSLTSRLFAIILALPGVLFFISEGKSSRKLAIEGKKNGEG